MSGFTGFHGITDKGTRVWVMNEKAKDTGEKVYKVQAGRIAGYRGWNGGAYPDVIYTGGKVGYIAKSKVSRAKSAQ